MHAHRLIHVCSSSLVVGDTKLQVALDRRLVTPPFGKWNVINEHLLNLSRASTHGLGHDEIGDDGAPVITIWSAPG